MPLAEGAELGPYKISSLIGKGGMGEVYLARDPRLERDVAIKVSAARFTERFEREARTVAQLNHPNVCTLHDVGPNYLVMELVEGETLADRIKAGPIPLDEALRIAGQIIDGMEAAHEKGITHRDLKPANIKLKPDGLVKILDFGLAKHTPSGESGVLSGDSPTLTMGMTEAGVILGTANYMSPEQAKGKPVDKRADIWAFGVVLHEMLTGHRMFQQADMGDTLAAVIMKEPDFSAAPRRVHRLLKRCLEKDPRRRLRDIGDARMLLEEEPAPAVMPGVETPPLQAGLGARWSNVAWVASVLFAVALAGVSWIAWRATRPVEQPLVRLDVDLGPDTTLVDPNNTGGPAAILSPDGTRLVYVASVAGGRQKLFSRRLDQPKATELPGTEGASNPAFSPDGQWVAFLANSGNNKLSKISVEGGAVVPLIEPGGPASWGDDGGILFAQFQKGLVRVPPGGGAGTVVAEQASGEFTFWEPQILPGGKAAVFTVYKVPPDAATTTIEAVTLADHRRKILVRGGTSGKYIVASDGASYLLYTNKSTLFAIPFDPNKLETRGSAQPVLDDVAFNSGSNISQFAFSPGPLGHGTLVYRKGNGSADGGMMTLQWIDSAGKRETLAAKTGTYQAPRISPDGKRVAVQVTDSGLGDIWVYEWQRDAWTKLTFGGGIYIAPVWSPDGRYVVFGTFGGSGMFWTRADGAGQPQPLTQSKSLQAPTSFSPDGKRLAYLEVDLTGKGATNNQSWTVPIEDAGGQLKAGKPDRFLEDKFDDTAAMFSPDGRWLAYMSNESGRFEVYVRAFPPPSSGQGGKWLISNTGGRDPVWSRNGRDLLYKAGDQIMAASYTVKGDSFVPDKPRVWLTKLGTAGNPNAQMWDLAPDGKRVAVVAPVNAPEAPKADHEVVFLQNFLDELRRRVPAGK